MPYGELIAFLAKAVVISLSGVLAPGPVTAVTLAAGARNQHAGALVAVGHGIVEFPLMILVVIGVGRVFEIPQVRIGIALAGGVMLLLMAAGMFAEALKQGDVEPKASTRGPILTGIVLSIGNPYFLLWWATVGLTLATRAVSLGLIAFVLFAVLHWLCDLIWLEALSWTSFRGSKLFGKQTQRVVLSVCAAALLLFGGMFLYDAAADLLSRWR
jgi:threonine/homoserine/homoserine lactone efflux protein